MEQYAAGYFHPLPVDVDAVTTVFVDSDAKFSAMVAELTSGGLHAWAVDTETVYDGTDEVTVTVNGEQVSFPRNLSIGVDGDGPGAARVISVAARAGTDPNAARYQSWVVDVSTISADVLRSLGAAAVRIGHPYGWNANFDRLVLHRIGIDIRRWWDVMLFEALLKAGVYGRYASLATTVWRTFGVRLDGKTSTRLSYDADTELSAEQIRYAGADAIWTLLLGDRFGARLRETNLVDTALLEISAQPLIDSMVKNGLPFDTAGYLATVVDPARAGAAAAAEQLAVLTTGGELLDTIAAWARSTGRVNGGDSTAVGLAVLHGTEDPDAFGAFLADVSAGADRAADLVAKSAGGAGMVTDSLFSDEPALSCPFIIDDDTAVRAWLSKQVPTFAQVIVAAANDPTSDVAAVEAKAVADPAWLVSATAGKKRLVKAHDLDRVVLPALAVSALTEVTQELRGMATQLGAYRRYRRILDTYGGARVPVRLVPDWKLSAPEQVKAMLNRFDGDRVREFFTRTSGSPRLLDKADSVDSDMLTLIGGPLAAALLEFRRHDKVVSTYGDELVSHVHPLSGRIHARYFQGGTGTGRLKSSKPNAQNQSPAAKPFIRPNLTDGAVTRVLVAADLSQAELRAAADSSGDQAMLEAFATGEDLHVRTAAAMFALDMVALKACGDTAVSRCVDTVDGLAAQQVDDPSLPASQLFKRLRQKAKAVAFGYAYGLRGGSLAQQLSVQGVPTSKEEADALLSAFDVAYPQLAASMRARDEFIASVAANVLESADLDVDFAKSWQLHMLHAKVRAATAAGKARLGYTPSPNEVAEELITAEAVTARAVQAGRELSERDLAEELAAARAQAENSVVWASLYDVAPVLRRDGVTAWGFDSRTAGGRARWFQVSTADWEWGMVTAIVRSRDPEVVALRTGWVTATNAAAQAQAQADRAAGKTVRSVTQVVVEKKVHGRPRALWGKELEKQFTDRTLRTSLVSAVLTGAPYKADRLFRAALADRVRSAGNQYRNHPIQGGVADAMLAAMAEIDTALHRDFPSAAVVQSVHDSLVVECDVADAYAVRDLLVSAMEAGMSRFYPTVTAVADADIQLSLADSTKLTDAEVDALCQMCASTAA